MTRIWESDIQPGDHERVIVGDNARYLTTVVRVRVGEAVGVFDGRGGEWRGEVATIDRRTVTLRDLTPVAALPEAPVHVTLAIGLLKGDQMDTVVRDATAMGVASIAPLITEHVVVPAKAWTSGSVVDRWRRVAVSAAAQCGRATVPEIAAPRTLPDVLAANNGPVIVCLEPRAARTVTSDWRALPQPHHVLLLVGPEGGWAGHELQALAGANAVSLDLGPRTLRAELAPTAALSSLWTLWRPH